MLEALKEQIVQVAREAEAMGLCQHRSGNFSVRDAATGLICMTPTGVDRTMMQPSAVVVMNAQAEVVESLEGLRPTSEALMHLAAYEARPDAFAVVHTHSPLALSFAAARREIPAVTLEMAHLNCRRARVPVAPFGRQGTAALADSVREPLAESDAILLASHGALTVDKTLAGALLKAAYLEEIAGVYYRALQLTGGAEPPCLSTDDLCLRYPGAVKQKRIL